MLEVAQIRWLLTHAEDLVVLIVQHVAQVHPRQVLVLVVLPRFGIQQPPGDQLVPHVVDRLLDALRHGPDFQVGDRGGLGPFGRQVVIDRLLVGRVGRGKGLPDFLDDFIHPGDPAQGQVAVLQIVELTRQVGQAVHCGVHLLDSVIDKLADAAAREQGERLGGSSRHGKAELCLAPLEMDRLQLLAQLFEHIAGHLRDDLVVEGGHPLAAYPDVKT